VSHFEFAIHANKNCRGEQERAQAVNDPSAYRDLSLSCSRDNPARDFGGISLTWKLRSRKAKENDVIAPIKETTVGKSTTIANLSLPEAQFLQVSRRDRIMRSASLA
jgi:hypothetical protein